MTTIGLPTATRTVVDARTAGRRQRQIEALMVGFLVAADVVLVAGSFLTAYIVRFVLPDDVGAAFPLDLYVRTPFYHAGSFDAPPFTTLPNAPAAENRTPS